MQGNFGQPTAACWEGLRKVCMHWILSTTICVFFVVWQCKEERIKKIIWKKQVAPYPVNCEVFQPSNHYLRCFGWRRVWVMWSVYPRRERRKRRTISTNDHRSVLRHTAMCKNGQTKIVCLEEKIWAPEFLYERAFYPRGKYGRPPFIC